MNSPTLALSSIQVVVTEVFGVRRLIPCPRFSRRFTRRQRKRLRATWGNSPKHWWTEHPHRIFQLDSDPWTIYCTPPAHGEVLALMRDGASQETASYEPATWPSRPLQPFVPLHPDRRRTRAPSTDT